MDVAADDDVDVDDFFYQRAPSPLPAKVLQDLEQVSRRLAWPSLPHPHLYWALVKEKGQILVTQRRLQPAPRLQVPGTLTAPEFDPLSYHQGWGVGDQAGDWDSGTPTGDSSQMEGASVTVAEMKDLSTNLSGRLILKSDEAGNKVAKVDEGPNKVQAHPDVGDTFLYEPSLLASLSFKGAAVKFTPPIPSPSQPGPGLRVRPLSSGDFDRGNKNKPYKGV